MDNLLYYPSINLPDTDWTIRALLYYDNIGSIVPEQYFHEPDLYEPFMREAIQNELITPINPMFVMEHPFEVSERFCNYLSNNPKIIERRRLFGTPERGHFQGGRNSKTGNWDRLHIDKLDGEIFYHLTHWGLAERIDGYWYKVEKRTANELMTFLASVVANKIDYQPATYRMENSFSTTCANNQDFEWRARQYKRDLILKHLIPYPKQIDLTCLRRFKERHNDLLRSFRNKVELLVLNLTITPESPQFIMVLEQMKAAKEELYARMNESHWGEIVFGTVCGTIYNPQNEMFRLPETKCSAT